MTTSGLSARTRVPNEPCLILSLTIHRHRLNRSPRSIRQIRLALTAREIDHFVSHFDEHWDKIRPDVSAAANDDYPHGFLLTRPDNVF